MSGDHAALMDGVYRYQRHIYDFTRRYYLLGRDRLIAGLLPSAGGTVLEIGCGTGRNIVAAARRYPEARFYGLDISTEMLASAEASVRRAGLAGRVKLAIADATSFDAQALFGRREFDRVVISYALSMIPGWQAAIAAAIGAVAPGGSLHVVDFGRQERLPGWFGSMLRAWLRRFHVTPRDTLRAALESESRRIGATLGYDSIFGGYAVLATAVRPR